MTLKEYLAEKGVNSRRAAAERDNRSTTAMYSEPLVLEDNTVAFDVSATGLQETYKYT